MQAKNLKYLRSKKGDTQQQLADMLGITRQGYAKYENDLGEPDNATLIKLADYFKVTTDYLLGIDSEPKSTQKDKEEAEFQAFKNDPSLQKWYKELPESEEEDLQKLRTIWEMIKNEVN